MPDVLDVPRTPDEITPQWLSAVLGTQVRAATVTPIGTGQTGATYRAGLTFADPAGLPASVVVKLASQNPQVRERVALGYQAELAFYRDIAPTLQVPVPTVYHCAMAENGIEFALVMGELDGATQGDQLAGCSREVATRAVEALAGLHGPRWSDPAWLDQPGITMPRATADFARGMGDLARLAVATVDERLGDRMSDDDRATLREAAELVDPWLAHEPDRFALLHGDFRLDNLLIAPAGPRVTVVDWQTLSVGLPARDLAYFLATSLQPADRRDYERDLVRAYHRRLQDLGVARYHADECWHDYRLGLLQVPMITALGFAFSAETDRGDDMILTMFERGNLALREHGTLDLVAELAGV